MSEAITTAGPDSRTSSSVIARHPNASVALGSGSGLGALVVWIAGLTGLAMPAEVGAAIAGLIAATVLFIGHRGIKGALRELWRGD